jgi:hypothetical protein
MPAATSAVAFCAADAVPTVSLNVRSWVRSRSAGAAGLQNPGTRDGARELGSRSRPASVIEVGAGPPGSPDPADLVAPDTRLTGCCGLCVRVFTAALGLSTARSSRGPLRV